MDGDTSPKRPAQAAGQRGIELERDHPRAGVGERGREHAPARADIDDEVAGRDSCFQDELRCEPATAEEVLAGSAPCGTLPNGHGRPPS